MKLWLLGIQQESQYWDESDPILESNGSFLECNGGISKIPNEISHELQ